MTAVDRRGLTTSHYPLEVTMAATQMTIWERRFNYIAGCLGFSPAQFVQHVDPRMGALAGIVGMPASAGSAGTRTRTKSRTRTRTKSATAGTARSRKRTPAAPASY